MNIAEILHILACPECHGNLRLEGSESEPLGLYCEHCACVYPIEDQIPILLTNEAIALSDWQQRQKNK